MRSTTLLVSLFLSHAAFAQTFPSRQEDWVPLRCANAVMTDRFGDEPGALSERDIVGDTSNVAGARAADGKFLYLRLRLDADPIPAGAPRPFAWGILLDTDANLSTYEVLIHVNGIGKVVSLYKNSTTTSSNDPTDAPDEPSVKSYPLETHARSQAVAGSNFGGNTDYFLEFAVPWEDLAAVGIGRSTPVVTWAATSTNSTTLNGDLACFDNGTGGKSLSGTGSSRGALDPGADSDGDGYTDGTEASAGTDPNDASSRPTGTPDANVLAGGGGCQSGAGPLALLGVTALVLLTHRRRALWRSRIG